MSVSEMLRGLPSHNENNFSRFHSEASRNTSKKPAVYLPTKDFPSDQVSNKHESVKPADPNSIQQWILLGSAGSCNDVITTEKTNILLRYLHQQWDKKNNQKKRDRSRANIEENPSPAHKVPRLDTSSGTCG